MELQNIILLCNSFPDLTQLTLRFTFPQGAALCARSAVSLPICSFSPLAHIPAICNKTSYFLAFPAAIHSSDNRTTLQLLILLIEWDIYKKRNTSETWPHRCLPLQTGTRGDRWEGWSPFPLSQRRWDAAQPQVQFHAHRNTESSLQRQVLSDFKEPSHWSTAGGKCKQKTKLNPEPCALPSTPRRCCIKLRHYASSTCCLSLCTDQPPKGIQ